MQLPVPSSNHPQVQIETVTPEATLTTTVDKSHKVAHIALPEGTDENRVQHFARYLTSRGQVVGETMVHINGSWETLTEELHARLKVEAGAAEEAAKAKALAAEKATKAATDVAKARASATASSAKSAVEHAASAVKETVTAHETEISAAVAGAKIAAEVAG